MVFFGNHIFCTEVAIICNTASQIVNIVPMSITENIPVRCLKASLQSLFCLLCPSYNNFCDCRLSLDDRFVKGLEVDKVVISPAQGRERMEVYASVAFA